MPNSAFYDADELEKLAINLFHGWGYNFYRVENQLRADNQLVRNKASWLLGVAMASVRDAESDYRREHLPPPTRAKPYPDAEAVAGAQRLERVGRDIGALEALIQQQPVPENDRMTQRYRLEAPTLQALTNSDQQLVGQCELLRSMVNGKDGASLLSAVAELEGGLEAIRTTLRSRAAILLDRAP